MNPMNPMNPKGNEGNESPADSEDLDDDLFNPSSLSTLEPLMFATARAAHWRGRKVSSYLRVIQVPQLSPVAIHRQQTLFNEFLKEFSANQTYNRNRGRVVIYKIHKDAGLGNMIRGYVTAMAVAILTNRAVQGMLKMSLFKISKSSQRYLLSLLHPSFSQGV